MNAKHNLEFLIRLKSLLSNPMAKNEAIEIIQEIDEQEQTELLYNIKWQLKSPSFLREWCINEVSTAIRKEFN